MAQLGSAGALGALGRRFESCRPDSKDALSSQAFDASRSTFLTQQKDPYSAAGKRQSLSQ